jgi:hypothetical protein
VGSYVRSGKWFLSTWYLRSWLRNLRLIALNNAFIKLNSKNNGNAMPAAKDFATALEATLIPGESQQEWSDKLTRALREKVSRGIRFPDWRLTDAEGFHGRTA